MPPPLPAPQCAQLTAKWSLNGRTGSNRFQCQYTGTWNTVDALVLTGNVHTAWDTDILPGLSQDFHMIEWEIVDLADVTHGAVTQADLSVGGQTHESLPNNVTMDIYWPVNSRVRGGHSHTFLTGFVDEDLVDPLHWQAGVVSAYVTAAASLQAAFNSTILATMGNITMGVVHYHRHGAVLTPPVFEANNAPTVSPRVHSRSRRLQR